MRKNSENIQLHEYNNFGSNGLKFTTTILKVHSELKSSKKN